MRLCSSEWLTWERGVWCTMLSCLGLVQALPLSFLLYSTILISLLLFLLDDSAVMHTHNYNAKYTCMTRNAQAAQMKWLYSYTQNTSSEKGQSCVTCIRPKTKASWKHANITTCSHRAKSAKTPCTAHRPDTQQRLGFTNHFSTYSRQARPMGQTTRSAHPSCRPRRQG